MSFRSVIEEGGESGPPGEGVSGAVPFSGDSPSGAAVPLKRPLVLYVNESVTYEPLTAADASLRTSLAEGPSARHPGAGSVDAEGVPFPMPRPRGPWGEPVPEAWEFLPSPKRAKGVFETWPKRAHLAVPGLIGALFLVVSLVQWSGLGWNGAASGAAVYARGEAWRLLSALFAHGDLGHLGSNMLPFLFYGWMLQSYFGRWVFPVLAFAIGLASNAVTVALYPAQTQLLGASGMVYGMVALWLVLYLRFDQRRKLPARAARALAFALIMLMPTTYEPQVSYLAHASGFAAGVAGGLLVAPFVSLRDPT